MATEEIEIVSTVWTKISDPGESGTCWKKTGGTILIDHTNGSTAQTLPTGGALVNIDKSKRVPLDEDNDNVLLISADDSSDLYYAIAHNENDSNKLVVDIK